VIVHKLENEKKLSKEEIQCLYKAAAGHLLLPPLITEPNESNKDYLLKAKDLLKSHLKLPKTSKNTEKQPQRKRLIICKLNKEIKKSTIPIFPSETLHKKIRVLKPVRVMTSMAKHPLNIGCSSAMSKRQ